MPYGFRLFLPRIVTVVLASACLVHWPLADLNALAQARAKSRAAEAAAGKGARAALSERGLPQPVADMREAILSAVATGDIAEMRTALEWNELKPDVGAGPGTDIIAHWQKISADGEGREILAVLSELLTQPHAVLPVGRDPENNRLYIWPRFAEVAEAELTAEDRAARERLVPTPVREEMVRTGRYLWWRLAIGADGTWHAFRKAE